MTYWWVSLVFIVFMYVVVGMILCSNNFRKHPYNLIFLMFFTVCFSYLLSQLTSVYAYYYGGPLVLIAAGLTLFMVLGLTIYAIFSRNDFNSLIGAAFALLFSFAGFGFLCIVTF
jgi:FtsH-binding integral membrane protein